MAKRKIKYMLMPGWVTSISDGDRHYISFAMLIRLYKLMPADCVDGSPTSHMTKGMDTSELIILRPRIKGDYAECLEMHKEAANGKRESV